MLNNTFSPGDLVTFVETESRASGYPVHYRTVGRVIDLVSLPGEQWLFIAPLSFFCWVEGYPENGRRLPASRIHACLDRDVSPLFTL